MSKKKLIKFAAAIGWNLLISTLGLVLPRSKKIIVIGGWFGLRFSDNSRYLFLYLHKHKERYGFEQVYFFTRNADLYSELRSAGFSVLFPGTLKCVWFHMRAKFHVVDQVAEDISDKYSLGAIRVNLWHGFPIKKIDLYPNLQPIGSWFKRAKFWAARYSRGGWHRYKFLSTSAYFDTIIKRAWLLNDSDLLAGGYPRHLKIYSDELDYFNLAIENHYISNLIKLRAEHTKVIFYLPTFRNEAASPMGLENSMEVKKVVDMCLRTKSVLFYKGHFADIRNMNIPSDAIVQVDKDLDVYALIKYCDILITDYSSICLDVLLQTSMPIILYAYDLEYYRNLDRGFELNYEALYVGEIVSDIDSLIRVIDGMSSAYIEKYRASRKDLYLRLFSKFDDGVHLLCENMLELG